MNKLYLISIIVLLISCQKEQAPKTNIPDWFLPQIETLENSVPCFDCTITQISYNNKIYYDLYCGHWSCIYCNVYDSTGKLMEWSQEEFNNFVANKKNEMVIWKCGDKIN